MAWIDDIQNLIHWHVKPYDKASQLSDAVTAIALDVVNRQTEQANRMDEVIDELAAERDAANARAKDAEAEVERLQQELSVCRDLLQSVPEHSEAWYADICDYLETCEDAE